MDCPFCKLPADRIQGENNLSLLVRDAYPISQSHSLVIPKRHVSSWFDINPKEREAMLELLELGKKLIDKELLPDGYNIGINDGSAAGQTIPHLHLHLIPRFWGDVPDPRGGVRWVIAERAKYWA